MWKINFQNSESTWKRIYKKLWNQKSIHDFLKTKSKTFWNQNSIIYLLNPNPKSYKLFWNKKNENKFSKYDFLTKQNPKTKYKMFWNQKSKIVFRKTKPEIDNIFKSGSAISKIQKPMWDFRIDCENEWTEKTKHDFENNRDRFHF